MYYDQYAGIIQAVNNKLTSIETLTDEQKTDINAKLTGAETFMAGVKADQNSKQLHDDPAYNLDGIILTLETLKKETQAIFDRPPPKKEEPKKDEPMKDEKAEGEGAKAEEPPAEEKKEGEGDAEMKNEEGKTE